LRVVNLQGEVLGTVSHLLETGAHDVLVVKGDRERLIPFVGAYVVKVDLARADLVVDWGADF
jgi:16S rRNA processing protein RimM